MQVSSSEAHFKNSGKDAIGAIHILTGKLREEAEIMSSEKMEMFSIK